MVVLNRNLIYIIAIDDVTSQIKCSEYAEYGINSWMGWANKNDVDVMVVRSGDNRILKSKWNKYLIFDNIDNRYEKIAMVDADTMIKWDAPNIFDLYDDEFCGVIDNDNMWWVNNSINAYNKFFKGIDLDYYKYINSGMILFHRKHKSFIDKVFQFYMDNKNVLDNWDVPHSGTDQTVLNYMLRKHNIKIKYINPTWNLTAIHRKEMFSYNWQLEEDKTPFFMKYAYVWHFTGFPIENRIDIMKRLWENIGGEYE
jgi:hypothetical protein